MKWANPVQDRADEIKARRTSQALDQTAPAAPPHRMRLSIRKRAALRPAQRANLATGGQDVLVVRCECMAQINDQDRKPDARVDWHFWAFDYIALIPVTQPAGPIFEAHVAEYEAKRAAAAS